MYRYLGMIILAAALYACGTSTDNNTMLRTGEENKNEAGNTNPSDSVPGPAQQTMQDSLSTTNATETGGGTGNAAASETRRPLEGAASADSNSYRKPK